jgi:hypothetical protein
MAQKSICHANEMVILSTLSGLSTLAALSAPERSAGCCWCWLGGQWTQMEDELLRPPCSQDANGGDVGRSCQGCKRHPEMAALPAFPGARSICTRGATLAVALRGRLGRQKQKQMPERGRAAEVLSPGGILEGALAAEHRVATGGRQRHSMPWRRSRRWFGRSARADRSHRRGSPISPDPAEIRHICATTPILRFGVPR